MKIASLCIAFCLSFALMAQNRAVVSLTPEIQTGRSWQSETLAIPVEATPFLSWFMIWSGTASTLQVRFSRNGADWEAWQAVTPDDHAAQRPGRTIGQLSSTDATNRYFQVWADQPVGSLECHFYNPGNDPAGQPQSVASGSRSCPCPLPSHLTRTEWCPSGNCPPDPDPTPTVTTHLIVHHSAGTNSASDWAAVVRSVWDFHVNGNGWDDIGYNWLIDPNGVIYEGRGDGVLGAHFCAQNSGTTGVCMLGDFTSITPTATAVASLEALLAWKICDVGANPLDSAFHASSGLTLPYISGHRDGCNTACPGNAFYPTLPTVRQEVAEDIANCEATAIHEPQLLQNVQLAPNPVSSQLSVTLKAEGTGLLKATLADLHGHLLLQRRLEKYEAPLSFDLDLSLLPAGTYRLQLEMAGSTAGFWVVKM